MSSMKTRFSKLVLIFGILILNIGFASAASAQQTPSVSFPIAELGDCSDTSECKIYCNAAGHQLACTAFAERNHLKVVSPEHEAKLYAVAADGGPNGTCGFEENPIKACGSFCASADNLPTCVDYGEKHGLLTGERLNEARKVRDAVRSGIPLPKGCTDATSCEKLCKRPENLEVMRSCFSFAESAGILPTNITREKAEKMFDLIQKGFAFFKSVKDFDRCEDPKDADTLERCIAFGIESGVITETQAEAIKKSGGKRPGACANKQECERYCNSAEHEDECYRFAIEHNLLSHEDMQKLNEGTTRIREGLQQASPEASACLRAAIGSEKFDNIVAGIEIPPRELVEKMKLCLTTGTIEEYKRPPLPAAIEKCLEERGTLEQFKTHMGPFTETMRRMMESCSTVRTQTNDTPFNDQGIRQQTIPQEKELIIPKEFNEDSTLYDIYEADTNEELLQLKFKCSSVGGLWKNDTCLVKKNPQSLLLPPSLQEFLGNLFSILK
ncbi:MAG: hypothetical protein AAB407_00820 [Patescibacteria group bacterium]